jgi:hypothetical protein
MLQATNHLFIYLKKWLQSQPFNKNEKLLVDEKPQMWLSSQAADFFDFGSNGDYVEK